MNKEEFEKRVKIIVSAAASISSPETSYIPGAEKMTRDEMLSFYERIVEDFDVILERLMDEWQDPPG